MEKRTGEPTSRDISFQPLSEGLGFHPFSNGLPYAPISKVTSKSGSGATVAGASSFVAQLQRPQFAAPSNPVSQKLAQQAVQLNDARLAQAKQSASAASAASSLHEPIRQPGLDPMIEQGFGVGYSMKRVTAYLLDTSINLALCAGVLSVALWKQNVSPDILINPGVILVAALFIGFFSWALVTAQEIMFGTSVGKRIFGLALQGSVSAIFLRALFFIPSLGFCGLGLLWAAFDSKKRCWHDIAFSLQPIEIAQI